jgi:hypothetical protein
MMASDRDDVLSIIGPPWPGDARVVKAMRDFPPGASEPAGAYVVRVLHEARRAAELDAATPPEGAAQGREDAKDAARYRWIRDRAERMEAEYEYWLPTVSTIHFQPGSILNLIHETLDAAIDAALATQPTPAGGGA